MMCGFMPSFLINKMSEETYQYEVTEKTPKPRVYTVSQINREIRMWLEAQYASVWVEGEISNFKLHSSGHMYLTLKDEKSQISAVFFSRYNQAVKFDMKDGLKVVAFGKMSLYEPRGQYQLTIERIQPKGMGELQLAFLQLKEKLEKEGLFDPAHKKEIPKFPKVVGIVTSRTGAAIQDILNIMSRRSRSTEILIYPVQVQGEGAAKQIAQGIAEMNKLDNVDVLIVGRGGGSLEDLWAFNEEVVARAVFASRIPVISAVGHEIDWTICDFVADLRAPTPSAAAELVVQSGEELERHVRIVQARMKNAMSGMIEDKRAELENLTESYAFKQPGALIQQYSQRVDELLRQLGNYLKSLVRNRRQDFHNLAGRLNALSPLGILERGYSLNFSEKGVLLKDVRKLKVGDSVQTRLLHGRFHSKVTKIEEEKKS